MRLFLLLLLFPVLVNAQYVSHKHADDFPVLHEDKIDLNRVNNRESFVFYGLDFTRFVFDSDKNLVKEDGILEFIRQLNVSIEEKWIVGPNRSMLAKKLDKEIEVLNGGVHELHVERSLSSFFDTADVASLKEIKKIIANYPESNKADIGLAIIIEQFEEAKDRAVANFVFLGTDTKQILWNVRVQASVRGRDELTRWTAAVDRLMKHFTELYIRRFP